MAACIADMLERIAGPCLHSHLRMLDTTDDTELDIGLVACNAVHEAGVLAAERAAHRVTDVIAERSHLVHHVCVGLECDLLCRICRS